MPRTPISHPDRKAPKLRPFKALHHFRKLVANKEDTQHVFYIIEALSGRSLLRDYARFAKSKNGKARIEQRRFLPPLLDDHAPLRALPRTALGRAYVDFMTREGLSAAGLVQEYERFQKDSPSYDDMLTWYAQRLRDTHDLLHIITGYGRDALGEACVLAFSYGQNKNWGVLFIAYMTALEYKKRAPRGAPVFRAVRQAHKHGKAAQALAEQDIAALLPEPLQAIRAQIGANPPTAYTRVHAVCKAAGLDPFAVIG